MTRDKLYRALLDSFEAEGLDARDLADRDLLELIFFMLLERRQRLNRDSEFRSPTT
jgi:hypothetical protein